MRGNIVICGLGLVAALTGTSASAQSNYYGDTGNTIRCESKEGRLVYCGSAGDAQLLRQVSKTACIRGQTWGTDGRGLWVDRGCRGDFQVGLRGNGYGRGEWQGANGQVFNCESVNNRQRLCPVGGRGDVRLLRQLSDARCVEGQTWGRDGNGVWVTQGCRAEFQLVPGRRGSWNRWRDRDSDYYGNGYDSQRSLLCESRDGRSNRCAANIRRQVQLVRQLSSSPCIEGRSWGWDRSAVWVSEGCRAEFAVW